MYNDALWKNGKFYNIRAAFLSKGPSESLLSVQTRAVNAPNHNLTSISIFTSSLRCITKVPSVIFLNETHFNDYLLLELFLLGTENMISFQSKDRQVHLLRNDMFDLLREDLQFFQVFF